MEVQDEVRSPVRAHRTIDNRYLLGCWQNTVNRISSLEIDEYAKALAMVRLSKPFSKRDHVCVGPVHEGELKPIDSPTPFGQMLEQISNVRVVESYYGHDHGNAMIIDGILPDTWRARSPRIRGLHIPDRLYSSGKVVQRKNRGKPGWFNTCDSLEPIWTHEEFMGVREDIIRQVYHRVWFKVRIADEVITAWDPGLAPDSLGGEPIAVVGRSIKQ